MSASKDLEKGSSNPRALTNLAEVLSCLSSLESEEAELSHSLSELLSTKEPIVTSLDRLQSLVPQLDDLHSEASLLAKKVSSTAKTADRVGGRVRLLDEEMRRVREASDRVGQVMDLKSSLVALQSAIDVHDWESATRHCTRAMAIPVEVTTGPFAENAVPTSESHLPPSQTLQAAREQLLEIFRRQFDQASQARDAAATTRFFKLFPTIGWEAEGLQAYATFVVDLVRLKAPASAKTSSPLYYITALTALFESVAVIVDQHQPVVEKYYGKGKMKSVIERLLEECDRTAGKLIAGWEEERSMKRKLTDTQSSVINTRRVGSTVEEEEATDPREIDKALSEAAAMASRWALFKKFLIESLEEAEEGADNDETSLRGVPVGSTAQETQSSILTESIEATSSHRLFEEMLSVYYVPLEIWYLRSAIDKAHRLSSVDMSETRAMTTTPDDVFYILKLVINRLLSTGSVDAVERTTEQVKDIMDREYSSVIKKKLDDVYRNVPNVGASARDKVDRENRFSFIIHLNDLDVSTSHLEQLTKDLASSGSITQCYLSLKQSVVTEVVSSISSVGNKFKSTLRAGVEQLFNQLMRPKLRTLVIDVYKDVTYTLNDDSYAQAEHQDVVRKRFVKAWDNLVEGYKDAFTEGNYRLFFGLALDVLVRPLEKHILTMKFSELGAIRFDRDLRSMTTYLSTHTVFGDARDKFSRLQQISTILNLDADEDVEEFFSSSGIRWKLSSHEVRHVSSLKIS